MACAGFGTRMGLKQPKQFLEYQGKPIFLKPLLCAEHSSLIGEIVIVTQQEYIPYIEELCHQEGIRKVAAIVCGGKERQDSIYAGLRALRQEYPYIIVQDAARPFCKEKYFNLTVEAVESGYDGAVVGVPVKDTIKICSDAGDLLETPPRRLLFAAHTPQVFRRDILLQAYQKAEEEKFLGTDDASLVERLGYRVKAILGDEDNIKITVPEDLKFLND